MKSDTQKQIATPQRIWTVNGEDGGIWAAFDAESKATGYPGPRMLECAKRTVVEYIRAGSYEAMREALERLTTAAEAINAQWVDSDELKALVKRWGKDSDTDNILALRAAIAAARAALALADEVNKS